MEGGNNNTGDDGTSSVGNSMKKAEHCKIFSSRDALAGGELWTDGLICAFEFICGPKILVQSKSGSRMSSRLQTDDSHSRLHVPSKGYTERLSPRIDKSKVSENSSINELRESVVHPDNNRDSQVHQSSQLQSFEKFEGSHWIPIGWARISELCQSVQVDSNWTSQSQQFESMDDEDDLTVADLAIPYWERPAALRNESRLISERMKHLLYEVPVRASGGLLFELLGQSAGDPFNDEDDIPIVLRSWQAQNFLVTVLHLKGPVSNINVLGITEVQELLSAGGYNVPRTVHELIAHLTCRLTRWDDRLFRKSIFGAADEIELKFMNRRNYEDMNLFSVILNQEIRRLSRQVIRVKWSLHAREEIVFELLQHLRGNAARILLEGIRKSTREMIEEQEAVRGRLFTIQDVMQSTVRAWLQDRSLRVTHNLAVFGGCGVVLTIITGLFGINVDGIPGAENTPYAFGLFTAILCLVGVILIVLGLLYLGLRRPITEEQVEVRKLELQELVKMFQHEAETHAQVRKNVSRNNLPPTASDTIPVDADYVLIQ
ncbi:hypothetical protein FNV43_RR05955 [Rhamnella rubrinervis]|uniref:Magnesium transporter CorA-like family protein n=1 Tax=Rhamnella rubrinervis TaxID=2594499 RepID=A0A8K0HCK3_9ROSA|nr:hypothetical protein FNV43_RR05955 [Rhamnella rubrinervis]